MTLPQLCSSLISCLILFLTKYHRSKIYSTGLLTNQLCTCLFVCSFPHIRDFNKHKFDYRLRQCVFIGYYYSHLGYKCMDKLRRVYISRHVQFAEAIFPFTLSTKTHWLGYDFSETLISPLSDPPGPLCSNFVTLKSSLFLYPPSILTPSSRSDQTTTITFNARSSLPVEDMSNLKSALNTIF